MQKGFKKNIRYTQDLQGQELRQSYLDKIAYKSTFLPQKIDYADLDNGVVDFITNDCQITIDGETVPVIFYTIQRWAEFTQSWAFTDEYRNIKIPFIIIIRRPDVQVGTNQAGLWNIPGRLNYTYYQIPTKDGREGFDLYKVPQPTSIDLTYDIKFFCNKLKDTNVLSMLLHHKFKSRQHYININNHPIPLHLETVSDESQTDDVEGRKFYIQNFEILSKAYILDDNDFEVVPTINRTILLTEINTKD